MRKITQRFIDWCNDNSAAAKLERTIFQGVIGVLVGIVAIVATGEGVVGMIVAPIIMSILSPIQAKIGEANKEE